MFNNYAYSKQFSASLLPTFLFGVAVRQVRLWIVSPWVLVFFKRWHFYKVSLVLLSLYGDYSFRWAEE